jgi:hypothetical protein
VSRVGAGLRAFAPAAVILVVGVILVAAEPVTSPWWINADADGIYTASALNVVSGDRSRYFDHPGLVTQEVLATTFGVVALPSGGPSRAWATTEITHLNRARPVFRGWAIAFFLGGALLAYALMRRLFGHWLWGVAGGLLWLAQPSLTDAIQIRPDVLLSGLMLLTGYAIVRAWERKSAAGFALAAALSGVAFMEKVAAEAILPALLLATVLAYPGPDWRAKLKKEAETFVRRHWVAVSSAVAVWLILFYLLNRHRLAVSTAGASLKYLGLAVFALFDYWLATLFAHRLLRWRWAKRLFDPFYLGVVGAFAAGIALPLLLMLNSSPWILSLSIESATGSNINAGITPFKGAVSIITSFPVLEAMVVIGLAGIAAVVGLVRRTAWPLIWFSAAATSTVLAAARSGAPRYYAPGYILGIPATLWLLRRVGNPRIEAALVSALVAGVLIPTFVHMRDDAHYANAIETQAAVTTQAADKLLKPHQFALVNGYDYPEADARWWSLVANYIYSAPSYPYRFVPDDPSAVQAASADGEHVAYYIGPQALTITHREQLALASGTYVATPVSGGEPLRLYGLGIVKLVSAPGT